MSAVLDVREPSARYLVSSPPSLLRSLDTVAGAAGGTARLRELILDLALRGKLVPQDSRDEHASTLLGRIRAVKANGPANGRAKVSGAGEISGDEPPHDLPLGWVWTSLSAIGQINPRIAAEDSTTASFVPMSSIPIAFTDTHVSEPRPWRDIKAGFTQFAEGDVGVAKITPCFENGKSTVFQNLNGGIGAGTTELHIVRPLCGIEPRYVLLFLKSPRFLHEGEAVMTGTAGQKRLPRAYFEKCPFPLPPLAEQARIVARVDELMRLCDALEERGRLGAEQHARLLSTLLGTLTDSATPEELAANWQRVAEHFDLLLDRPEAVDAMEQAVLDTAFKGLLLTEQPTDWRENQSEHSTAGDMGEEARGTRVPLATVCLQITDGEHATPERCDDRSQVPLVTAKNVRSEAMDLGNTDFVPMAVAERCWRRCRPKPGDILMVSVGATLGRLAVLRDAVEMVLVRSVTLIRPDPEKVDVSYLALHLMSPATQREIWGSVKQSAQPCLYLSKTSALSIWIPTLPEQRRIVARVTEFRRLCTTLRERLQAQQATQSRLAEALVEQALAG